MDSYTTQTQETKLTCGPNCARQYGDTGSKKMPKWLDRLPKILHGVTRGNEEKK